MTTSTVESVIGNVTALEPAFLVKLESTRDMFLGTFQGLGSFKNYVTQNCNSLIRTCACAYQWVTVY